MKEVRSVIFWIYVLTIGYKFEHLVPDVSLYQMLLFFIILLYSYLSIEVNFEKAAEEKDKENSDSHADQTSNDP